MNRIKVMILQNFNQIWKRIKPTRKMFQLWKFSK